MPSKSLNQSLHAAKATKQDESYTQYVDIQKEVEAYLEFDPDTFRGKVVYCNCDDPFESNFFKYFAANFNKLGLKKLITTSYKSDNADLFSLHDYEHSKCLVYERDKDGDRGAGGATLGKLTPVAAPLPRPKRPPSSARST